MSRSTTKKWDPTLPGTEKVITVAPRTRKAKAGSFTKALSKLHADSARKKREEVLTRRQELVRSSTVVMSPELHTRFEEASSEAVPFVSPESEP